MLDKLAQLRIKIDALDEQLQVLLNTRAKLAQDVAAAKNDSDDTNFYRAEREAQVLEKVKSRNKGPLSDEEIARLFREVMSACLALEQVMNIAFLGPEGTFTQSAALKHFGHSVKTLPLASIPDVFREVESGNASYGVVPIENSTEGVISHTLDQFMNSNLHICGEVDLRIHHHLLTNASDLSEIKVIYSHQQSLAQCREWLDTNLPGVEQKNVSSNAEAARQASSDSTAAAIAGDMAAEIYKLNTLVNNIEDEPDNTTRFLIIGKRETPACGKDKTSILISTQNKSGALHGILGPLVKNKISMTRIESRPSRRGMWDYVFFIDCEGHKDDKNVATAIAELEQEARFVRVLGSYPRAVL
ncbi:Chorismate mutase I / Prephenate dehydratase [hydrothermal vent metagenome]|uniref:Bifunctional chorismate mutase/prephenate dehydratase n=1 Tax=hydrothermal vent metagenome TaxID=652676 RepID=A0A3B0ZY49_9ZZZZ